MDKISDHEDDRTEFEINIINKRNEGLVIPCTLFQGEILPQHAFCVPDDALNFSQMSNIERIKINADETKQTFNQSSKFYGPKWMFLNENIQGDIMRFLFVSGIRPELGVCIEYLSWNKDQRLYMGWMRDIYAQLFVDQVKKRDSSENMKFKIPT